MARLPNNPYILTVYSNFIVETRRDGQAARTQLQLAQKPAPACLTDTSSMWHKKQPKSSSQKVGGLDAPLPRWGGGYTAAPQAHIRSAAEGRWCFLLVRERA
jgi:hypothetical protein